MRKLCFISEYTFKVEELTQNETGRKTELPKGQIDDIIALGQDDRRIESVYVGDAQFVTVAHDGLPSLEAWDGATASQSEFSNRIPELQIRRDNRNYLRIILPNAQ